MLKVLSACGILTLAAGNAHALKTCTTVDSTTIIQQMSYREHDVKAILDCYDGVGTLELTIDGEDVQSYEFFDHNRSDFAQVDGLVFAVFGDKDLFSAYVVQGVTYNQSFNFSFKIDCKIDPQGQGCVYQPGGG